MIIHNGDFTGQPIMNETRFSKSMTVDEACLAPLLLIIAFLCLFGAAKAVDAAFAFPASLGAAAGLWAAFAIYSRYLDRSALLPAQEIDGRPNYNFGPMKFSTVTAMFWGIAGLSVGLSRSMRISSAWCLI